MRRTSAYRKPGRRGMTILEVLFAIMITTVGLLGAIAVFPVASEMAKKGRLNDEVTVCADAAVHKMDAQGMRRPDHWIAFVDNSPSPPSAFTGIQLSAAPAFYRTAFCLDPQFTAANIGNNLGNPYWTYFPAYPRQVAPSAANPGSPRMQRITLWNNHPTAPLPLGRFQANHWFKFPDQLVYERPGVQKGVVTPADNAEPAFQLYSEIKGTGINPSPAGKREDEGRLSWFATLVPKVDRYTGLLDDKYVLSVVVLYNRSPNLTIPDFSTNPPVTVLNEWTATILGGDFHSAGYGGGEATISIPATDPNAASKLKVRTGDWVMLSGHVLGTSGTSQVAIQTYKWYRISDADEDPYPEIINGVNYIRRDVTLIGPDWDMQDILPLNGPNNPGDGFADDVEVTIIPHIVTVYDRTVRLEVDGPAN